MTNKKLKQIYTDLWSPYNPLSQSRKLHITMLLYKNLRKIWTLYIWNKDRFVNVFQARLSQIKVELNYKIKTLYVNGKKKLYFHYHQRVL